MGVLGELVRLAYGTFGVFLLPAAVFFVGVVLYAALWALGRATDR